MEKQWSKENGAKTERKLAAFTKRGRGKKQTKKTHHTHTPTDQKVPNQHKQNVTAALDKKMTCPVCNDCSSSSAKC